MTLQDLEAIEPEEISRSAAREALQYWPLVPVIPVVAGLTHLIARPRAWSRGEKAVLALAGAAVGLNLVAWQLRRLRTQKPPYEVLASDGPLELRRYPALVVAQTRVNMGFDSALKEGFGRLAGFIFGRNAGHEKVAMTSPVVAQHEVLDVNAPPTVENDAGYTVSFMMPRELSMNELPIPEDDRVILRELQPRTVVALKFRGRYDAERVRQATRQLLDSAREHEIEVRGEPAFAGYDAPSTLPILRRNEVWVEVAEP
jgi:hypothetical protein